MAETYITTFKLRRGYAAVWEENNPILQEGEPGYALDTKVLKIGDGNTPWLELEPVNGEYEGLQAAISQVEAKIIGKAGTGQNSEIFNDANNQAIGDNSHAEGLATNAKGNVSHAEGESTIAYTTGSHAEGKSTKAGGESDSVIGGAYTHAEGVSTIAKNRGSHAEGNLTKAFGDYSHAEGNETQTTAVDAHSEGRLTKAITRQAHAEGDSTLAGNGTRDVNNLSPLSAYGVGAAAHAEGIGAFSKGGAAHAEGYKTQAIGNSSHAEGNSTEANGESSHAEGHSTLSAGEASHTEGRYTNAVGVSAHAEGGYLRRCYLEGTAGVYKVYDSQTSEMPSWLNGYYYNAGSESAIEGQPLDGVKIYNGNYAHIGTITSSYSGTGDDLYIRVNGITGTFTTASEDVFLIAWSKAEGTSSHSEGGGLAVGNFSHAEGTMTWAAHQSHAEGHMSASMNTGSHAEGIQTRAHGQASHAEGFNTFAAGKYSHVQGKYNLKDDAVDDEGNGKYAHIVGNGSSGNPSNAHTIDWDGNAWFAGNIKVGGTSQDDENAVEVLTTADMSKIVEAVLAALSANQ